MLRPIVPGVVYLKEAELPQLVSSAALPGWRHPPWYLLDGQHQWPVGSRSAWFHMVYGGQQTVHTRSLGVGAIDNGCLQ